MPFSLLLKQVIQSFPGRHAEISRLVEARDEEIGDGPLEVVISLVPALILKTDYGDRILDFLDERGFLSGENAPDKHSSKHKKDNNRSYDKEPLKTELDRCSPYLPRGERLLFRERWLRYWSPRLHFRWPSLVGCGFRDCAREASAFFFKKSIKEKRGECQTVIHCG